MFSPASSLRSLAPRAVAKRRCSESSRASKRRQLGVSRSTAAGCGKAAMLGIIEGLERATVGGIEIEGREGTGGGPDRGFVFQTHGLLPGLTPSDNIAFAPQAKGIPASQHQAVIERVLATVGL